jgi:hypothetical protein
MAGQRTQRPARLPAQYVGRLGVVVPVLVYLVIVLTGASTSSLGIAQLREDPAAPLGSTWGEPRQIRSDEYLTLTTQELSVLAVGRATHSPLAEGPDMTFQVSSGQLFETILFGEYNLLRLGPHLPDVQLFAAVRAFPVLVLALALPPLLRRWGATTPLSWLGFGLALLAPTTAWWSLTPVRILAHASLGCLLLVLAHEQWQRHPARSRRLLAGALAAVGGIVLARFATYYVPWYLTLGLPLVLATAAYLLREAPRRAALTVLGIGAVAGGVVLGGTLAENMPAIRATLDTVYPGLRRLSGAAVSPYSLWGAPGLAPLQDGALPTVLNPSELASAYLFCGVWAVWLLRRGLPGVDPARRAAVWTLVATNGVWLLWCTTAWGALGEHVPILNRVDPLRAAQTVGYGAAMVLVLALSLAGPVTRRQAVVPALLCAGITLFGLLDVRAVLPELTSWRVALVVVLLGVGVWAVSVRPTGPVVLLACLLLVLPVAQVNPVTFGLGDLRASDAATSARRLADRAREADRVVASESRDTSAMLVANGVPSLTGWQISGPDVEAWEALDPGGAQEEAWNRGASYITMTFSKSGGPAVVTAPYTDVIAVEANPCRLPDELRVGWIVATSERDNSCLRLVREFTWGGAPQYLYSVEG